MKLRGETPLRALTRGIGIAGFLLCVSFAQGAAAQEASRPDAPIAGVLVVNQERLIAQSAYGQRIQQELEAASSELSAENRRIEARLTEEELQLTELRDTLAGDEFRALADEFDMRVEGIRAAQEAKARNITEQADAAQARFFERVAPILLEIVRSRGAAVLMDSRAVLLSAERVDITEVAISEIDAALGDGGPEPVISLGNGNGAPANAEAPSSEEEPDPGE